MKKVLFATTALIATAGVAAADVTLSGYAEMGLYGASGSETQFANDIDVTFKMSGETDGGLSFGTAVDLDEALNGSTAAGFATNGAMGDDAAHGGVSAFIKGAFGTLTLGDTDGGFDWAMGEVPTGSGSIKDNETGHSGWNGNSGLDGTFDGQILSYTHSVAGLGFALTLEMDQAGVSDPVMGLGVKYSVADVNLGAGYQSTTVGTDGRSVIGFSLGTKLGVASVGANFSSQSRDSWANDQTHAAVGVSYSMDAITVGFNYGAYSDVAGVAGADKSGFGVTAGSDLGGGAKVLFGYGSSDPVTGSSTDSWSLGLAMSF